MRVALRDHQHKGLPFALALQGAGHQIVPAGEPADVFLTDFDIEHPAYSALLAYYADTPVVVYPHGACPIVAYDGLYARHPQTSLYLVPAAGHEEVMRTYGFDGEIVVCGFPFCDLLPFRGKPGPKRVVFAPHHPLGDGWISDAARQQNAYAYRRVLALGLDVTVRLFGTPAMNGLWPEPGVAWVQSDLNLGHDDIDNTDVVVAGYGTYPFLAVARGCPTVTYGADREAYDGSGQRCAEHWADYEHLMRYPLDIGMAAAVERACADDLAAVEWRERMVGTPFEPARVVSAIEAVVTANLNRA